jgi:prophage regulatory protein
LIAVRAVNGNPRAHQRSPGACDAFLPLLPHGHDALQHAATLINVASFAMNNPVQADRILRIRTVLDRTGLTRSTLYRKVAEGSFPRQVAISRRCVGWRASDLDAWLRNPMFFHVDDQ